MAKASYRRLSSLDFSNVRDRGLERSYRRRYIRESVKRERALHSRHRLEESLDFDFFDPQTMPVFRHIAWVGQTQSFFVPR